MKIIKILLASIIVIVLICSGTAYYYLDSKQPQRSGTLNLPGLKQKVDVHYDKWAIPHIYAENEKDAYFALGYLHAQERLFHMELLRRLSKGQLSEILGPKLISTDTFFRTIRLKQFGEEYIRQQAKDTPGYEISSAYIKGINHFIKTGPTPIEFDILKIKKTPFTTADAISVAGYMAYSFATGFKSDPLYSFILDSLGEEYLQDLEYKLSTRPPLKLLTQTHASMGKIAGLVADIETKFSPIGFFEGSNAWAVSGTRTKSGRPILAGDPHIAYSCPSVWYEAHIVTPDHELYGHFLSGYPLPLLGLNSKMAWSLTMFQNDDLDMFREKPNPDNPDQVWSDNKWTDLVIEDEIIKVKGGDDILIKVRQSKHGPIINDVIDGLKSAKEPIAISWAFHDVSNKIIDGLYELSHVQTVFEANHALKKVHAPGLNFVMADSEGNIGWWAVAGLPIRPGHVDPNFIMDGSNPENDYLGTLDFSQNPQFINPSSGFIVSANHQPQDFGTGTIPGYYNIDNRAKRIQELLNSKQSGWTAQDMMKIQLDTKSAFCLEIRDTQVNILKNLDAAKQDKTAVKVLELYENWDGFHKLESIGPTIFNCFHFNLATAIFKDDLGDDFFKAFLRTRLPDRSMNKILNLKDSPWWDNKNTPAITESREDIILAAWQKTLAQLKTLFGDDPGKWVWEKAHTVEFVHAIGRKKPMDKIFNIGPFSVEGSREVPNFQGFGISAPPYAVNIGPSTRRVIDFGDPENSYGINPTGQSGYFFNKQFDDQSALFINGQYRTHLLNKKDIMTQKKDTLNLLP